MYNAGEIDTPPSSDYTESSGLSDEILYDEKSKLSKNLKLQIGKII